MQLSIICPVRLTWRRIKDLHPEMTLKPAILLRSADDADPMSGLAFKIMNDPICRFVDICAGLFGHSKKGDAFSIPPKGSASALAV